MTEADLLDGLGRCLRQRVEEALDPRETVRAVVKGREKEALVLTDRRIIIAKGSLLLGGSNALVLSDVSRVTAGLTAVAIYVRTGDQYEFSFWPLPQNRDAAQGLVQLFQSAQLSDGSDSSPSDDTSPSSVADEIAKLAQLRDQGVLTEEFRQQKSSLLAGAAE